MTKKIFGFKVPNKECTDNKCPFHGNIVVKKEFIKGKIVKKDINRSATIEWARSTYVPKYERYKMKMSKMRTHNPGCINAEIGQTVIVARTKPLSKMKHFVIVQIADENNKELSRKNKE